MRRGRGSELADTTLFVAGIELIEIVSTREQSLDLDVDRVC